jgi:hypothetical protein
MDIIFLLTGLAIGGLVVWLIRRGAVSHGGEQTKLITTIELLKSESNRLANNLEIEKGNSKNLQDQNNRLTTEIEVNKEAARLVNNQKEELTKEIERSKTENTLYLKRGTDLSNELAVTRQKLEHAEQLAQKAQTRVTQFEKEEEFRKQEHSNLIASFRQAQERIQRDRDREIEERNRLEIDRIHKLKETWVNHEENVKNRIKAICSRHAVEYLDKVPFKGTPDNTLRINDEFIVFDAKSPSNDILDHFPIYLKAQVGQAIKYVREEDVRKEVFLVVPTNTLEVIAQFEHKLADYTVYIISIDALEPIILALQKIEEYEFADQLSPEERENICRVIGKFIHLSKRRIQIDGFFAKQFFELVFKSEADLPKDLMEKVIEFEKSEKLNPPTERRSKQISAKELESETERMKSEASRQGILTADNALIKDLNKIPLYSVEPGKEKDKDQGDLFGQGI